MVTSVASSQATEAVAKKHGAKVMRTKVGSVEISRTILERGAVFGFEENGGCLYLPHIAVRDGGMTTALMLECLAGKGMSFSKALSFVVPRYHQAKTKVEVSPKVVLPAMRAVERLAKGEVERVDGIKVWTDEHSWVLVRPSGTEPVLRIFAESKTEEEAQQLVRKFERAVKSASA